jgi:hypothetical protein
MAEKKPSIHKTLLILLLVFTPPFWLLFTDEGSRVSDTALLWLLGKDDIKISLPDLDSAYSSDDIRSIYPDNEWQCGSQATDFGDALCAASIGTFNGFPAQVVTFYFRGDRLSAMKLIYRELYHEQVLGHVIEKLGQPANVAEALADGPDAADIIEWPIQGHLLVMKKSLQGGDEPALVWLAGTPKG